MPDRESPGRRRLFAVAALGLAVAVGAWALVAEDTPPPVVMQPIDPKNLSKPRSLRASQGEAYRYFAGHCGLRFMVDFDASFWDVDASSMNEDEDARFGINNDEGTITLIDERTAVYRSLKGGDATLHRRAGAGEPRSCA